MIPTRRTTRLAAGLGIAGASVLLLAGPAAADTSQARASAATVSLLNSSLLNTGVVSATNDGTMTAPGTVSGANGTVTLPGQTVLGAGVLSQTALARPNGTSAACAGAVGTNGVIQIGANGVCTGTGGITGGVTVSLQGLADIRADVILAQCTASSTSPPPVGSSTIANANVFLLGAPLPIVLTPTGAVNQAPIVIPGIASIRLNEQIINPNGSLTVNALHVVLLPNLLGTNAAEVVVGSVTCGPNAVTAPVSLFAGPALPTAAAGAVAVGGLFVLRRRRRVA